MYQALERLEQSRQPDEKVGVDPRLGARTAGHGLYLHALLDALFEIRSIPYQDFELDPRALQVLLGDRPSLLVVADGDSIPRLERSFTVSPLATLGSRQVRDGGNATVWHELPFAAQLAQFSEQFARRKAQNGCTDCAEHAVLRLSRR